MAAKFFALDTFRAVNLFDSAFSPYFFLNYMEIVIYDDILGISGENL